MSSYSGMYGQVTFGASTYAEANHWSMSLAADSVQYGYFGGSGRKAGCVGQGFATGTIEGKYDFATPLEDIANLGDEITLKLYLTTTGGDRTERYFEVPAKTTGLDIDVEGDSGAPVSWTINWISDGAWTDPTG